MSQERDIRARSCRAPSRVAIGRAGLALASLLWLAPAAAQEVDYTCRFGEAQRRVQLEQGERPEGLPCQVLYTKGGREQVLWRADSSVGFCRGKALDLVDRLEAAGWTCRNGARAEPEEVRAAGREEPAPGAGRPAGADSPEPQPPRAALAPAPASPDRAGFEQAVERDLARLNASRQQPGGFVARRGVLGDLDGDGVGEAAIIVAYGTGATPAQFLLLYRFDGESFVPVAKKGLGEPGRIGHSEVERIEHDAIHVRMLVFQADDPACCPTGERRVLFNLHDGQLVEVGPDKLADRGEPAIR